MESIGWVASEGSVELLDSVESVPFGSASKPPGVPAPARTLHRWLLKPVFGRPFILCDKIALQIEGCQSQAGISQTLLSGSLKPLQRHGIALGYFLPCS